jgi:ribulose-5-phosphate 4-epimerase/fuculose-1-phosphate aldolase
MSEDARLAEAICRFGRSLFERGLTPGSSGNISVRLEDGSWIATPTNASLGFLDPARLSRLDASGKLVSGDPPTKEIPLHAALYASRPDDRAIVHLHSTHGVAVSMLPGLDAQDVLPPLTAYYLMRVGRTALVPYFRPGDPAVTEAIEALGGRFACVLLANHGPILAARDLDAAVYGIEEFEETAKLFLMVRALNPRLLTGEQIRDLVRVFNLPADVAETAERHHAGGLESPVGFLARHVKGS